LRAFVNGIIWRTVLPATSAMTAIWSVTCGTGSADFGLPDFWSDFWSPPPARIRSFAAAASFGLNSSAIAACCPTAQDDDVQT
jgi:hypothetical protein